MEEKIDDILTDKEYRRVDDLWDIITSARICDVHVSFYNNLPYLEGRDVLESMCREILRLRAELDELKSNGN